MTPGVLDHCIGILRSAARAALFLSAIILLSSPARAQDAQMQALAKEQLKAIAKSKQKSILVMDFQGPEEFVTPFGERLADVLSSELAKFTQGIQVIDRVHLSEEIKANGLARSALRYSDVGAAIAQQLHAKLVVVGSLARDSNSGALKAAVDLYRLDSGKDLQSLSVLIPLIASSDPSLRPIEHIGMEPENIPFAAVKGISAVQCIYCPAAQFTEAAKDHKYAGTVDLTVIVGTDGVATDIYPTQAAEYGLTWSAVHTVRSWRFRPATDPLGNPIMVRQKIQVVFHLY